MSDRQGGLGFPSLPPGVRLAQLGPSLHPLGLGLILPIRSFQGRFWWNAPGFTVSWACPTSPVGAAPAVGSMNSWSAPGHGSLSSPGQTDRRKPEDQPVHRSVPPPGLLGTQAGATGSVSAHGSPRETAGEAGRPGWARRATSPASGRQDGPGGGGVAHVITPSLVCSCVCVSVSPCVLCMMGS